MTKEIPKYVLRAYGLLFNKFGTKKEFSQDSLNWLSSSSMKKKIFAILLNSGWIAKKLRKSYICVNPKKIFNLLFSFKVPKILKKSKKQYCYSKMSAVEILTDYSYIQRSWERSPYFIKIKKLDLDYWKKFLAKENIHFLIKEGNFIGEFVILEPETKLNCFIYNNLPVENLDEVVKFCQNNSLFEYPLAYLKKKFKLKIKVAKSMLAKVQEAI